MNFLIDAQLPRRMAAWLTAAGCDTIHTLDLPDGNRTTDAQIIDMADLEQRVVISKDADFVDTHILQGRPAKLLLISTGKHQQYGLGIRKIKGVILLIDSCQRYEKRTPIGD